jgi:hypothetical protein
MSDCESAADRICSMPTRQATEQGLSANCTLNFSMELTRATLLQVSDFSNTAPVRPDRSRTTEFSEPVAVSLLKAGKAVPQHTYGGEGGEEV